MVNRDRPEAVRMVLVTAPSRPVAQDLARALVRERLVACVNVIPGVWSVYRWKGEVETADEVVLLLKTRSDQVDTLRERVVALHPYDVPEFIVVSVDGGLEDYLRWIRTEAAPGSA